MKSIILLAIALALVPGLQSRVVSTRPALVPVVVRPGIIEDNVQIETRPQEVPCADEEDKPTIEILPAPVQPQPPVAGGDDVVAPGDRPTIEILPSPVVRPEVRPLPELLPEESKEAKPFPVRPSPETRPLPVEEDSSVPEFLPGIIVPEQDKPTIEILPAPIVRPETRPFPVNPSPEAKPLPIEDKPTIEILPAPVQPQPPVAGGDDVVAPGDRPTIEILPSPVVRPEIRPLPELLPEESKEAKPFPARPSPETRPLPVEEESSVPEAKPFPVLPSPETRPLPVEQDKPTIEILPAPIVKPEARPLPIQDQPTIEILPAPVVRPEVRPLPELLPEQSKEAKPFPARPSPETRPLPVEEESSVPEFLPGIIVPEKDQPTIEILPAPIVRPETRPFPVNPKPEAKPLPIEDGPTIEILPAPIQPQPPVAGGDDVVLPPSKPLPPVAGGDDVVAPPTQECSQELIETLQKIIAEQAKPIIF